LSLITKRPFCIHQIRAARDRPGLQRQHLTAVKAAAQIGRADIHGAEVGSNRLTFKPAVVAAGEYSFDIGTAGSTPLVLQTVLPPLMLAGGASQVVLQGGTHNPNAPPFDFVARSFLPLVERIGPRVTAKLERPGFYPAGGGKVTLAIEPATRFEWLQLVERGRVRHQRVRAIVAKLPRQIAERELRTVADELGWDEKYLEIEEWNNSRSPGNVVLIEIETEGVTEVFSAIGQRGVRAEVVAQQVAREAAEYLEANVPVGPHLADQLILPLALGAGGVFVTTEPTLHTITNIEVVKIFLDVDITVTPMGRHQTMIRVEKSDK
jgi:RNA 3'-terminal phosphate cyclase (ATP)